MKKQKNTPPPQEPILVTRSSLPDFADYVAEIRDLWDSRWLTNMGCKHQQLEAALTACLDVPYLSLFSNGHLALEAALQVLGLKGDVITTPFTFASTTAAIVRSGLNPVFCDIRADDGTLDADLIEPLINERTCAIMPVHVYGLPCDSEAIDKLAARYRLPVIYDAAHAFGVQVDGRGIGRSGTISMFSFHATKLYHTIEGGALTFADPALSEPLRQIKNFGITGQESVDSIGGNAKLNELQAAMGLCNLRRVEQDIAARLALTARYRERLSESGQLSLPGTRPGVQPNGAYFPVFCRAGQMQRDNVCQALKQQGILARKYFYPLTSDFACYRGRFDSRSTPVARALAEQVLALPLYPDLTETSVERICRIVLQTL